MKKNRQSWVHRAAFAAGCTLLLVGCSSPAPSYEVASRWDEVWPEYAPDFESWERDAEFSDAQNAALQDREVTEEETYAGFERFRACLRDEGYELVDVRNDGPFISFGIPDAAVQSGVEAICYASEYAGVDVVWQISHSDERDYAGRLGDCVMDNGIDFSEFDAGPTTADLEQLLIDAGIDPAECPEPTY